MSGGKAVSERTPRHLAVSVAAIQFVRMRQSQDGAICWGWHEFLSCEMLFCCPRRYFENLRRNWRHSIPGRLLRESERLHDTTGACFVGRDMDYVGRDRSFPKGIVQRLPKRCSNALATVGSKLALCCDKSILGLPDFSLGFPFPIMPQSRLRREHHIGHAV